MVFGGRDLDTFGSRGAGVPVAALDGPVPGLPVSSVPEFRLFCSRAPITLGARHSADSVAVLHIRSVPG